MRDVAEHKTIDFSQLYFLLRKKEGRIYSDEALRMLPEINVQHPLYQEWQVRKRSCHKLMKYLNKKPRPLEILEVGCGNGWLSAKLSDIPSSHVTGIDINTEEIDQAKRVFGEIENLEFLLSALQDVSIKHRRFDVIVFAASIQYFSSLKEVVKEAMGHLKTRGEIHIIDSQLYTEQEVDLARQRSNEYYKKIGFPEMKHQYFHHLVKEIKMFNCTILYDPHTFLNKLKRNKNPLYWVCVKANA